VRPDGAAEGGTGAADGRGAPDGGTGTADGRDAPDDGTGTADGGTGAGVRPDGAAEA